jgi:polysaccharide pyruvyl transferase CsaB
MKVVLSGYYGFDNVGDEAILYSIIQALRDNEPGIEITVLSNNPPFTEKTYNVKAVDRWSMLAVCKALIASDGLISGGGSLLQDETKLRSIPYYTGVIQFANLIRKPVFIYAQGIGPLHHPFSRAVVKKVLRKTEVTVRDQASKKLLERIGVQNPIKIVPDPVLGLKLAEQISTWWEKQAFTGSVVTVSVRDWPSSADYKHKMAEALDKIAQEGKQIVFVPMHGKHDEKASKETAEKMKEKSYIAPYDASIEEKIAIIGKSDLLVGMRLHALIFSSITYTPFIAISYDPKIEAFAEIAGQPVAGHVMDESWNGSSLSQAIRAALQNKGAESAHLEETIGHLQREAGSTAQKAIQYFEKEVKGDKIGEGSLKKR